MEGETQGSSLLFTDAIVFLQIILWGRTEKCLKETTEEIRATGTECHYFICDVGNREEVYRQAKAVREKVGGRRCAWENLEPANPWQG